jgi:hypothetical protein
MHEALFGLFHLLSLVRLARPWRTQPLPKAQPPVAESAIRAAVRQPFRGSTP